MKRLTRMLIAVGSLAVIALSAHVSEAAAEWQCPACWYDCEVGSGTEFACDDQCGSEWHAAYCIGPDEWGYCDSFIFDYDTVIECLL